MLTAKRVVLLCGLAGVAAAGDSCGVDDFDRVDCKQGAQGACEQAGCCWKPAGQGSSTPWCFYKAGEHTAPQCTLKSAPKEPFSAAEVAVIRQLFAANLDINGSGMVVAAPDHDTGPGGDYYFAWARDGALSMNALLQTSPEFDHAVEEKMDHWLAWVERSLRQTPVDGRDVFTEPKFLIPGGEPFPGGWCRPQTDGPGLRAITLIAYTHAKPSVVQRAWETVRRELDWVAANYTAEGCDLWEEVHAADFFWNRYTMRKALLQGAAFAASLGKAPDAARYRAAAKEIEGKLASHVESTGFVMESEGRRVDTAVLQAFNVGDMDDGVFAPLSGEVVATLSGLTKLYCKTFKLNQDAAKASIPGVLYGRYDGDGYDGGNPWILDTAAAAMLLYRQSKALAAGAAVAPEAAAALQGLLGQEVTAANLLGAGDAVLNRMRTFLTNGLHMNEQIGREDGVLKSAKDLTWNYANVLKAMKARSEAAAAVSGAATASLFV